MADDPLLNSNLPGNVPPPANSTPLSNPAVPPTGANIAQVASPPPAVAQPEINPLPLSQSPPPPAGGGIDWNAAVQNFAQQQHAKATGNLMAAQDVDPDKAAAAAVLAPVLGLPASAMEQDSGFWQSQFQLRANRAVMSTDANLQNWIASDPGNARIASDDVQQLGLFGRLARGFQEATLTSQANQLEASEGAHIITPMQTDLLQTLKEQIGQQQQADQAADSQGRQVTYQPGRSARQALLSSTAPTPKTAPALTLGGVAQGAGGFAGQLAEAIPAVAAGAATGAGLGALGGPGGVVGGALTGAGRGLVYGFAGDTAVDTYGQTYDTLANATDKFGNHVSELNRQSWSLIAGAFSGALAGVGGGEAAPFIREVATEAATRPALSAAIQKFALGTAKAGVTGALVNGGIGLVQTLAPQIAEAITSPDFKTVINDPVQRTALVHQTVDDFENGGLFLGALHAPMAGVSLVMDAARAEAASQALQSWQGMQDGAAGSKLRGRAPNAFAALMKTYTGDGSIGVPGNKVAELYQKIGTHPGATDDPFRFVPDMQAQLERAQLTGGDVILPTAEFTARLAGTPIEQALRPDIRFNPDGMTMREAMEFRAANPSEFEPADLSNVTDADAGDVSPRAQDEAAIQADMVAQLRQAGQTPDQAEQNASFVRAFFGTLGNRLNLSPLDLYRAEGLQVRRETEHTAGPANYSGADEVIDALRRGDKQVTDKELYGPSLTEFLRKAGGLKDEGGDLKAMGAKGRLINPNGMSLDKAAQRAFQPGAFDHAGHGYFPDHTEDRPPTSNDLLDAVRDELNGNKRYLTPSTKALESQQFRQAQRDLDQFLTERGIDIKTASNADIKTAWRQAAGGVGELSQESAGGAVRGSITMAEGAHIIRLFRQSNASTFPHEAMHFFADVMQRAAEREDAPQQLRDDVEAMRKFAGLKPGQRMDITTPEGVAAQEKLATAFETYLMEGKAPSVELRGVFQKFAAWLARVYRGLLNSGTPINDAIRGVMDRMLATDDAIEEARQGLGMRNPLFFDAESAGMTPAEFAIYTNKIAKAKTDMYDRVLRRAMRTEELRRTQEWRTAADQARPGIDAQVKARPVLQAWKFLAAGKDLTGQADEVEAGKLSASAVQDILGAAYPRFPRGLTGRDGMHPDMVAPAFGYGTGEEMLRDLVNENVGRQEAGAALGRDLSFDAYVRRLVDQALDRDLEARFGDPLQDGTIEEIAMKAAHDAAQLDVIATEIRALAKQVAHGTPPVAPGFVRMYHGGTEYRGGSRWLTPDLKYAIGYAAKSTGARVHYVDLPENSPHLVKSYDDTGTGNKAPYVHFDAPEEIARGLKPFSAPTNIKPPFSARQIEQWVRSSFADTAMNKATRVSMYRRAEAKAANDAQRALLANKPVEAFQAKQRQMIAHLSAAEADRLQGLWQRTTAQWRAIAKQPTRLGTNQAYVDQVHRILTMIGMPVKRYAGELARGLEGKSLEDFVRQNADMGNDIAVPNFLLNPRAPMFYGELTADQFEATRDAIASLMHVGRAVESVRLEGKQYELQELADAAQDRMMAIPDRALGSRLNPERARDIQGVMHMMASVGRAVDASLVKMEQLFAELDDFEHQGKGPFLQMFDQIKRAQHAEYDRLETIAQQWIDLKSMVPKDWAKGLRDRFTVPELKDPDTGQPINMTRDELLGMALNVGNIGPTSNFEKLTKGFGWDGEAVMRVLRQRMTKADWDFVQGVWDIFASLTSDVEALHREVSGVGFPRVEANPIETPHGTYRGGYFPIIYDPVRAPSPSAAAQAEGIFDKDYFRATTSKGHTIGRVEYNAPLKLGLNQIFGKLSQVVHDLTHRQAIMDAWKFLNQPEVVKTVNRKLGPEYGRLFNPWLRDLANNANIDDKKIDWIDNMFRRIRISTSAVGIGFRLTTVIKHGLTAAANSITEVGGSEMLRAVRDLYGPGGRGVNVMVMEKSGEIRHRMETIDRDARESLKSLMGETSWIQNVQRLGYYPVAALDMASATPTWLAAYRTALSKGMSDDDAIAEGDRAVRFAHGSGGMADYAKIQRGPEWTKLLTMFYGFFNHMYNRERATVKLTASAIRSMKAGDRAGAGRDFTAVLGRSFGYLVVPALIEAMVSPSPDDKNDGWFEWGAKAILNQAAAGVPILRDLATSVLKGYSYEPSPVISALDSFDSTAKDIAHATGLSNVEVSPKWLQHSISTAGYATGLPVGQAASTGQYLWDVGNGDTSPQNVQDFISGLIHGPAKGQ